MFFSSVSQAKDSQKPAATNGQTDRTLNSGSYPVTQTSQSPPYTTPLSSKTELRSTRDHHVVDVRQQNTVVPPPQHAHARSDKPSKSNILKKLPCKNYYYLIACTVFLALRTAHYNFLLDVNIAFDDKNDARNSRRTKTSFNSQNGLPVMI